ncbi:hypothetical protein E2C01_025124 [Portunus trituberculatus]|uniref:Uncharacterized protein n=1 Tax=Portunus trituberculatus TaxID=210409 RepID=A0A5B7EF54_PORTR|nr:hypothetical protein [Portunus trituberculatus]
MKVEFIFSIWKPPMLVFSFSMELGEPELFWASHRDVEGPGWSTLSFSILALRHSCKYSFRLAVVVLNIPERFTGSPYVLLRCFPPYSHHSPLPLIVELVTY